MASTEQPIDINALKTLYHNGLYSIDQLGRPQEPAQPGKIKKKYLLLLRENVVPGDSLHQFLFGILNACKIALADVNQVNGFRQDADYQTLAADYGQAYVIMFGVEPADLRLPVYFPHYQVQAHNGITYISSPDLASIENDKAAKQQLWQSLKKAFSL